MTESLTDMDRQVMAGRSHALSALEMIEQAQSPEKARAYAAGFLAGARNYLLRDYGPRETYALLSGLADEVITPHLPKDKAA